MANLNLFSLLLNGSPPDLVNKSLMPVLTDFNPVLKLMINFNAGNKHLITLLRILVFLIITSCINDVNYDGDMLNMLNNARTTGYICQGEKFKPVKIMSWDSQLEKAALIQSNYMDSVGELKHDWNDGTQLKDRLVFVGYYSDRASENLAVGPTSEAEVLQNWLNSPPHCAAIMFNGYDIVAVARKGNYWTMVLGYKFHE